MDCPVVGMQMKIEMNKQMERWHLHCTPMGGNLINFYVDVSMNLLTCLGKCDFSSTAKLWTQNR